jgi:hypothetical protein
LGNLKPQDICEVCNCKITAEHKRLLEKTLLAQTWCLVCLSNWVNSQPFTSEKGKVLMEFKTLSVLLN